MSLILALNDSKNYRGFFDVVVLKMLKNKFAVSGIDDEIFAIYSCMIPVNFTNNDYLVRIN